MSAVEDDVREVVTAESGTLAILNSSEIDRQIATAHKYPRSIKRFRADMFDLVTLTEEVARECIYALPRKQDGKRVTIEGPSARFAEIVAHSWGNARAGARVVDDTGDFITAQGVFHDLQANVAITYEVKRRIVDRDGRRYSADMIMTTANAACSIALRNAVLKGVPKAMWVDAYDAARKIILGDSKTLATRRAHALQVMQKFGMQADDVCTVLGVAGVDDIGLEDLVTLHGMGTALKDGDTTVERLIAEATGEQPAAKTSTASAKARERAQGKGKEPDTPKADPKPAAPAAAASDGKAYPIGDMLLMATESESVGQLQYVQGLSRAHLTPDESAQLDEAIEGSRRRFAEK
jgi:hypothetical protein